MRGPKRHHIIPVRSLKRFVNSDRKLWCRFPSGQIDLRNPESVFWRRHLFSFEQADGVLDPLPEEFFGVVEDRGQNVLDKILEQAIERDTFALSTEEKFRLIEFITHLILRSPDRVPAMGLREYRLLYDKLLETAKKKLGPHRVGEIEALDADNMRARIYRNARLHSLIKPDEVTALLERKSVYLVRKAPSRRGFLIGSQPELRDYLTTPDLRHSRSAIGMPVSPEYLLYIGPNQYGGRVITDPTGSLVTQVNKSIAIASSWVAGCTKRDLA